MIFLILMTKFVWSAALFSDPQIEQFVLDVKKQNKIPEPAVDKIFDFYKNNRSSVGGLKDQSCVEEKSYKIRWQDGKKLTKEQLKAGIENESCLCVIDYTKSKNDERGHCIFLQKDAPPMIESFLVAHGRGSVEVDGKPTTFTNSLKPTGTTLSGLFLTANETYKFQGEAIMKYTSVGLGLYGVEKSNWTAASVGKVTHGAPYVEDDPAKKNVGNSLGCPAMPVKTAARLLPRCKGRAAWLNFTEEVKNSKQVKPVGC